MSQKSLEFWQERWMELRTPWDMRGVHPHHDQLIDQAVRLKLLPEHASILEPGCGRAHAGADLAKRGYQVTSCDYVPEAVAEAKKLYDTMPGLSVVVADILDPAQQVYASSTDHSPKGSSNRRFQAVYDRAMLCALQPEQRSTYIKRCFDSLDDAGIFMGIIFADVQGIEHGPPFALPMDKMVELMQPYFTLVWAVEHTTGMHDTCIAKETVCIWLKV